MPRIFAVEPTGVRFPTSRLLDGSDAMKPAPAYSLAYVVYVEVSGSLDNVVVEYVDHLQEHVLEPVRGERGRYVAPFAPGFSAEMHTELVLPTRSQTLPCGEPDPPARADLTNPKIPT